MVTRDIPGQEKISIQPLVLDYNGTLALDGMLLPERLEHLRRIFATLRN